MDNLVEMRSLGKRYAKFALEGLDLTVEAGTVVGLVGSNGAGKTTALKALLGLVYPDSGIVRLLGADPAGAAGARAREQVGVVLDSCTLPGDLRVAEAGSMGRIMFGSWSDQRFRQLAGAFGLDPRKRVKELSRGMGMKLSLAMALAHDPQLLVLDEATAGLDPLARDEVLDLLRCFMEQPGRGILMASHITSDLEKLADYVVCLDQGRVAFSCPKDDICDGAGIARLGEDRLRSVTQAAALEPGSLRVLRQAYGCELLVPDRLAFARAFPDIPVERATIEAYMALMLKGETL